MIIIRVHNYSAYDWNRCVAPHGNLGNVDPDIVAKMCDDFGIPWYTDGWPYASGIKAYCTDNELWKRIISHAKY